MDRIDIYLYNTCGEWGGKLKHVVHRVEDAVFEEAIEMK